MNTCKLCGLLLCSTVLTAVSMTSYAQTAKLYEAIYNDTTGVNAGKTQSVGLTEDTALYNDTVEALGQTAGDLTIFGATDTSTDPETQYDVGLRGTMAVKGTNASNKATFTALRIGKGEYTLDSETGDLTKITADKYWTNLQKNTDTTADLPALIAENANIHLQTVVFAGSKNTNADTTNGNGGAVRLKANTSTKSISNIFFQNSTQRHGGAIDIDDSTAVVETIQGNYFMENTAKLHGGALDVGGTIKEMKDSQFVQNTTEGEGGAIHLEGGTITAASGNRFLANEAADGGAIYVGTHTNDDDSVANSSVTITGSSYKENSATGSGGAVYVEAGNTFNSTNETYTGNTAKDGAAIYSAGKTTLSGATITGNEATGNGGAVYNKGEMTITGATRISGNKAALGSNAYNAEGGTLTIKNVTDNVDLDYEPFNTTGGANPGGTLFDQTGDVYNAGTLTFDNSKIQLHNGINTNSSLTDTTRKVGTVNVNNSSIDLGGAGVDGDGTIYANTVNINEGSTIRTHVGIDETKFGKIDAKDITVAENNTTLGVVVGVGALQAGQSKTYQILNAENGVDGEFASVKNNIYDIVANGDGSYTISMAAPTNPTDPTDPTDPTEPTDPTDPTDPTNPTNPTQPTQPTQPPETIWCPDGNCDQNENNTAAGWLTVAEFEEGTVARDIQDQLNTLAQLGCESDEFRDALDGLAPDVSPLIQAHATEIMRRLSAITSERFYNSMERTGYVHNNKRFYRFPRHESNLWVQGMYGKSKYDIRKGWDMDTEGIAVGFDGHVTEALRMGLSYAYTKADGESVGRDTEIDSHTGMIYGEYNPNRYYANWLAMYTRSQYSENKKVFQHRVKADYDVDAIGAQLMIGRKMGPYVSGNWASGVIKPELGLRYLYTKQHGYTDSIGQKVGSADGQTLTGILGAQYTIAYTLSPSLSWYPEFRAALTYDFIEPDTTMRVNLVNGSMYDVTTENMDRFGIEVGAKVGIDINRQTEIAVEYEGLFKGDYTNHTGLANLKYKF